MAGQQKGWNRSTSDRIRIPKIMKVQKSIRNGNEGASGSTARQDGISVVIPCHNEAKYVGQAIQSVIEQTYSPIEILVVDDGSTDDTREVAEGFGSAVEYLYQDHGGVCRARNFGIGVARFAHIIFLDADDRMVADAAEIMISTMDQYGEGCALMTAGIHLTGDDGVPTAEASMEMPDTMITFEDLILRNRVAGSPMARKQAILDVGGFDETLSHSEDRDLWIRLAARWQVVKVGHTLTIVIDRPSSASKNAEKMKTGMMRVLRKSRQLECSDSVSETDWIAARSVVHYQCSLIFSTQGLQLSAIKELLFSLFLYPGSLRHVFPESPSFPRLRRLIGLFCFRMRTPLR